MSAPVAGPRTWGQGPSLAPGPIGVCCMVGGGLGVFRPGAGDIGGAELKLSRLARALAADPEFRVTLHCWGREREELAEGSLRIKASRYSPALLAGIPLVRAIPPAMGLVRAMAADRARVYVQTCAGSDTSFAALAATLAGGRFIYWVASIEELGGIVEQALPWHTRRMYRWALGRADRIVCQTDEQQRLLSREFGGRTVVIPNPFAGDPAAQRSEGKGRGEGVLWAGHWTSAKDPDALLELARRLPRLRFTMVVSRRATQEPPAIPPNVTVHYQVPHQEMASYYRSARVLVNTSRFEGFPNVYLEAAWAGVPIVSLRANPDGVLEREGIGMCAGGDLDRMAEQVRRVDEDEGLWRDLSAKGPAYVQERHDPGRVLERFKSVVGELLSGSV